MLQETAMKRICEDCQQPLLVKNTFREHFDMTQYSYRCSDCQCKRVRAFIDSRRHALRLPAL
jgi:RNase P subunit RPR2